MKVPYNISRRRDMLERGPELLSRVAEGVGGVMAVVSHVSADFLRVFEALFLFLC